MKWTKIRRCLFCEEFKHLRIPDVPNARFCTQRCAAAWGIEASLDKCLTYCEFCHHWLDEQEAEHHLCSGSGEET